MSAGSVKKIIKDKEIEYVDLRFTDPRGKLQHVTMDATIVDEEMIHNYNNCNLRFLLMQVICTCFSRILVVVSGSRENNSMQLVFRKNVQKGWSVSELSKNVDLNRVLPKVSTENLSCSSRFLTSCTFEIKHFFATLSHQYYKSLKFS